MKVNSREFQTDIRGLWQLTDICLREFQIILIDSWSFREFQKVCQGLQNVSERGLGRLKRFITKRGKGYNKTRQVLQNEAMVITKRGRYNKTRQGL